MLEGGSWDCWNLISLAHHPQIFLCSPPSREFQRLQKLSGKYKDFTAAFGNKYPTSLILDIKEWEESMYVQKKILLVSDPDSRLLLAFYGRWMGLSPYFRLEIWAHEVRKKAGREAQLLLKKTNFNFLTGVPRSCTSVLQTYQAQNILYFPLWSVLSRATFLPFPPRLSFHLSFLANNP